MPGDPVDAANDNFRAAFVGLAELLADGETRQFGPVSVASAGLPLPEYNRAFAFEVPSGDELRAAVSWLERRGRPFWVTTTPAVVEAVEGFPAAFDLGRSHDQPGMVLGSLADVPPPESPAEVAEVTDAGDLDEFVGVFASVFGRSKAVTARAYRPLVPDENAGLFVGRLDGEAVACGVLSRSGDVAGVYAVGVREGFRRRGLGETVTRTVLRVGRDAGCRVGTLQSTEMGRPLYEAMGFETVVTYRTFEPTG